MTDQNPQLGKALERPYPSPIGFARLKIWLRDSATALGVSLVAVLVMLGLLLVGRLQWPGSDPGIPSVEISAVSLSPAERKELELPETSMAAAKTAKTAEVKTNTAPARRVKADKAADSGRRFSDKASGAAAEVLSDNDAVTEAALEAIRQTQGELRALAEPLTLGDGTTRLKVNPGDGKSAEFFGIRTPGRRFVYVIDRSGSMASGDQRFLKANKELLTSVLRLRSRQQFFVCYFNTASTPMPGGALAKADRNGKQKLANWMHSVFPLGGTDPSSSLQIAVRMKPDAVFLLTDGQFGPPALQLLRQINPPGKGQVSVNTIAFVTRAGEQLLKQIAQENRGDYRFVP